MWTDKEREEILKDIEKNKGNDAELKRIHDRIYDDYLAKRSLDHVADDVKLMIDFNGRQVEVETLHAMFPTSRTTKILEMKHKRNKIVRDMKERAKQVKEKRGIKGKEERNNATNKATS